jgi:hypothetical protein
VVNLDNFIEVMSHAISEDGSVERACYKAIKIDDGDGLGCFIGFSSSIICKVDFYLMHDENIQFIELTDLEYSIQACLLSQSTEYSKKELELGRELTSREKKAIRKLVWEPITSEFKRKWCGSIAVIERLFRKNSLQFDPTYKLLIVCNNGNDIRLLDELSNKLNGMMGNVVISNTSNIENKLIDIIPAI